MSCFEFRSLKVIPISCLSMRPSKLSQKLCRDAAIPSCSSPHKNKGCPNDKTRQQISFGYDKYLIPKREHNFCRTKTHIPVLYFFRERKFRNCLGKRWLKRTMFSHFCGVWRKRRWIYSMRQMFQCRCSTNDLTSEFRDLPRKKWQFKIRREILKWKQAKLH